MDEVRFPKACPDWWRPGITRNRQVRYEIWLRIGKQMTSLIANRLEIELQQRAVSATAESGK